MDCISSCAAAEVLGPGRCGAGHTASVCACQSARSGVVERFRADGTPVRRLGRRHASRSDPSGRAGSHEQSAAPRWPPRRRGTVTPGAQRGTLVAPTSKLPARPWKRRMAPDSLRARPPSPQVRLVRRSSSTASLSTATATALRRRDKPGRQRAAPAAAASPGVSHPAAQGPSPIGRRRPRKVTCAGRRRPRRPSRIRRRASLRVSMTPTAQLTATATAITPARTAVRSSAAGRPRRDRGRKLNSLEVAIMLANGGATRHMSRAAPLPAVCSDTSA